MAGLAAERAFDFHLLKKHMLLEAAACKCTLQMQPSAGQSIPAPAQAVEPAILTPAVLAPERRRKSAGCA